LKLTSYLDKKIGQPQPEAGEAVPPSPPGRKPWAKPVIAWIVLALALICLPIILEGLQGRIEMRHDQDAIIARVAGIAQLAEGVQKLGSDSDFTTQERDYTIAMKEGRYFDATSICERKIAGADSPEYSSRADAYFMMERYEDALHDYQAEISHWLNDPNKIAPSVFHLATNYNCRADTYFHLGCYKEAVRDYRLSLALNCVAPNLTGACLIGAAEICQSVGWYEQAAKLQREASRHLSSVSTPEPVPRNPYEHKG